MCKIKRFCAEGCGQVKVRKTDTVCPRCSALLQDEDIFRWEPPMFNQPRAKGRGYRKAKRSNSPKRQKAV